MSCIFPFCFGRVAEKPGPSRLAWEVDYRETNLTRYFNIGIIGKLGCGRHSLVWRLNNMENPGLPPKLSKERAIEIGSLVIDVDLGSHRWLKERGNAVINVRFVPPENVNHSYFFCRLRGGIWSCDALVFCVDIGDTGSKALFDFYMIKCNISTGGLAVPCLIVVGNKRDLSDKPDALTNFKPMDSRSRRLPYFECSAFNGDGMDRVMKALLRMLLRKNRRY